MTDPAIRMQELANSYQALITDFMDEDGLSPEEKKIIWSKIYVLVYGKEKLVDEKKKGMSYEDARKWAANTSMAFGKHSGVKIKDVPIEYLEWLANQPDFRRDLLRYMESEYYETCRG